MAKWVCVEVLSEWQVDLVKHDSLCMLVLSCVSYGTYVLVTCIMDHCIRLEKASIMITILQDRGGCLHRMCSLQAHKDCVSQ